MGSAALPFCLARTRPGVVHWTFMLQPFWAIWVEKMGFFASRIAVTLFLTLWICRTQGQHGGMENQGKSHSPIFSYLRFSSGALVWSRTTLVKRFLPQYMTDACLYISDIFLCQKQRGKMLISLCMQIVRFFVIFVGVRTTDNHESVIVFGSSI